MKPVLVVPARQVQAVASIVVLAASAAALAAAPTVRTDSFLGLDGVRVVVQVVSADPTASRLQVVHAPAAVALQDKPATLEGLSSSQAFVRPADKWRALFNAGFSSYRTDVPVGLLVSDGKVLSPIDSSPARVAGGSGSAACPVAAEAKFRFSGVLCVRSDNQAWQILRTQDYQPGACRQAVQAGPLLVEPGGTVGVCEATPDAKPSARTVACIDAANRLHMVQAAPTHLHPLAQWLAAGPLRCQVAMNLAGADQSGWIQLSTWRRQIPEAHAGVKAALPSALLLSER